MKIPETDNEHDQTMTINHMTQNSCNLNNTANSDQLRSIENTI